MAQTINQGIVIIKAPNSVVANSVIAKGGAYCVSLMLDTSIENTLTLTICNATTPKGA